MTHRHHKNLAIASASTLWLSNFFVAARAFQCGRAAERDERNGFPYTAALEWRKAADLVPPDSRAAEYFWSQWERIMRLPRRLAGPCELFSAAPFIDETALRMQPREAA